MNFIDSLSFLSVNSFQWCNHRFHGKGIILRVSSGKACASRDHSFSFFFLQTFINFGVVR